LNEAYAGQFITASRADPSEVRPDSSQGFLNRPEENYGEDGPCGGRPFRRAAHCLPEMPLEVCSTLQAQDRS